MCRRSCSSGGGTKGVHVPGSTLRPQNAILSDFRCAAKEEECGGRVRRRRRKWEAQAEMAFSHFSATAARGRQNSGT